ncbi:hypothetical protein [Plantactinospora sp. GCM10030261]|uniref:hypothetical protein n=1 Tax=Plantactinospora sp. GCM10030261 TaxID=3273420 RepID=UPI00361D2097
MADDIRREFTRLAEPVVPRPEPYHRLLGRVRRRRQRRMVVAGAAGAAAVAVALPVLAPVGLPGVTGAASSPPPAVGTYQPPSEIDSELVRRLLESPTRGNLAGDRELIAEIERGYRAAQAELLVAPSLDQVKVLLAHDTPTARSVVVAFRDDTHAVIRETWGEAAAPVADLVKQTGTPNEAAPLPPYILGSRHSPANDGMAADLAVGLAPADCLVETSNDGRIGADGTVARTWQRTGPEGFVVRGPGQTAERWRITCDGEVRYAGPGAGGEVRRYPEPARPPVSTVGARGTVDQAVAGSAVRRLDWLLGKNGLVGEPSRVLWGGRLPDWVTGVSPEAVLVESCSTDGGCAGLLDTKTDRPGPDDRSGPIPHSTTIGRPDLLVLRLPGETGGVLIAGPERAVRAELLDGKGRTVTSGLLDAGVGAIRVAKPGEVARVKLLDGQGRTVTVADSKAPRLDEYRGLGEPSVWN